MTLKKSDRHVLQAKWRFLRTIDKNILNSGFIFDYQIIKKLTQLTINGRVEYEVSSDL